MKVLGLITARGGSKTLPRKNVLPFDGKPLIAHTVEAALGLKTRIDRLVLSSDDEEIAEAARAAGADVPFVRPASLSADDTSSLDVVLQALATLKNDANYQPDWVLLLQPTSPLRTSEDLHRAIDLAGTGHYTSIIGVCDANDTHPLKLKIEDRNILRPYDLTQNDEGMRRQNFQPPVLKTNGACYLTRRDVIERGSLFGSRPAPLLMPKERSVDIDDEVDFIVAEALFRKFVSASATR